MPIYQYQCEDGHLYEEYQSIKDFDKNKIVTCQECQKQMESYFGEPVMGFVRNDPTTVGQLGERNFKALGKIKGEEMLAKKKEDEDKTLKANNLLGKEEYRAVRKLANLTPSQKRRYIMEGKLP